MNRFNTLRTAFTAQLDLVAAALCLVPAIGFLLAWHMQIDLAGFTAAITLPALVALMAIEVWMAAKAPQLFNRVAAGLVGGTVATLALDLVRLPAAYLVKGAPDFVPMIGQHLTHEMIGIAPTAKAMLLGYGYHYVLMGALLGVAYTLVAGRVRRSFALPAGVALGVAFALLPQFQLLAVATGFSLQLAIAVAIAGFGLAGAALGAIADRRGAAQITQVTFMREARVEVK